MEATEILTRMAHNNAWANLRLHRAAGALDDAAYRAPRTGFFPSIHLTLCHILFVDLYYVDALEAGGVGYATWAEEERFTAAEDLAAVREAQRAVDRRLIAATIAAPLDRSVRIDRGARGTQVEARGDVLLHLFEHQIHHRGQAHAMLSGTAVAPPQLDEFFMATELPLRRDELIELGLPLR